MKLAHKMIQLNKNKYVSLKSDQNNGDSFTMNSDNYTILLV